MSRRNRPGSGRITLDDVAGHVGVSKITVSRALRQPDKVAPPLRQRILDAVDTLGYIPNRQAGSLASARTHAIALLVPSLSNGVFSDVLRGVDDIVQDTGYQVLLGHSGYSLREEEHLVSTYLGYGVEGFILPSGQHTERTLSLLSRAGLPVVEIMGLSNTPVDMSVGLDHELAGYSMTQALIEAGFQQIGFGGARMDHRARQRRQGWARALREAGRRDDICMTTTRPSSFRFGGELLNDMMTRWPALDALFMCNDDLAAGALFECQRRGILLPDDLALAGFNGMDITASTEPALTTVLTPRRTIGQEAARRLLARLEGDSSLSPSLDVGFEILWRASTTRTGR